MTKQQPSAVLAAMLEQLAEIGPTWDQERQTAWLAAFEAYVRVSYPGKPKRVRRRRVVETT